MQTLTHSPNTSNVDRVIPCTIMIALSSVMGPPTLSNLTILGCALIVLHGHSGDGVILCKMFV
jgi:hypothetical protein